MTAPSIDVGADDNDAALLRRYATAGDTAAVEELLRRHLDFLYRTALRWHGRAPDAEDAVQTAILHVLQQARQFRGQGSVRSWLLTVLLNVLRRQARDAQTQRAREDRMIATHAESTTPATASEATELAAAALGSVNGLPPHYRLPLSLHFLEQMSMREVAAALAIPEKTVRSQIDRGLELVRETLAATGCAIALPALPGVLAAAQLAPAPVALSSAVHALVLNATATGAATTGALAGSKGASAGLFALKAGIPALLVIGALAAALHFSNGAKPAPLVTQGDAPAPAPTPAPVAASVPSDLAEMLAKKVDVNFWREYPVEALNYLKSQSGLRYSCPANVEEAFTFDLKQKNISVREVLDRLAVAGGLELEVAHDRVMLWKKADDARIAELTQRLKSTDRWDRAGAAWNLSWLGDKRVPALLLQACGDKDAGVAQYASQGLYRFLGVLPFSDVRTAEMNEAVATAERTAAVKGDDRCFELLGALNISAATAKLIALAENPIPAKRADGLKGLKWDRSVAALDYLLNKAAHLSDPVAPNVVATELPWDALETLVPTALSYSDDPRAAEALEKLAQGTRKSEKNQILVGNAIAGLVRINTPLTNATVAKLIADRETFMTLNRARDFNPCEPRTLDAVAKYHNDPDQSTQRLVQRALGLARDPRVLDALLAAATDRKNVNAHWGDAIGASRDPRGETLALQHFAEDKTLSQVVYSGSGAQVLLSTRNPAHLAEQMVIMKDTKADRAARLFAAATLSFSRALTEAQQTEYIDWLKGADREFLLAALFNGNPRGVFGSRMAWQKDARWIGMLAALASDADADVRRAAAASVAECRGPYAMKASIEMLNGKNAEVRDVVLVSICRQGSLIHTGDPLLSDALAGLLASDSTASAGMAACALGAVNDPRAPVAVLEQLARTPADMSGIRISNDGECTPRGALIELAVHGNAAAIAVLGKLVRVEGLDSNFLENLVKTGEPILCKTVENLAFDTTVGPEIQTDAALTLYSYAPAGQHDPRIVKAIRDLYANENLTAEKRNRITATLLRAGAAEDLDTIFTALRTVPVDAAPEGIGDLAFATPANPAAFRDRMIQFVHDATIDINLRTEAAGALLHMAGEKSVEFEARVYDPVDGLIEISKSAGMTENTRARMWSAFMESKEPRALAFVRNVLKSGTPQDQLPIAGWLGWTQGDEESIGILLKMFATADPKTKEYLLNTFTNCLECKAVSDGDKLKIKAAMGADAKTKPNPFENKDGF